MVYGPEQLLYPLILLSTGATKTPPLNCCIAVGLQALTRRAGVEDFRGWLGWLGWPDANKHRLLPSCQAARLACKELF